METIIQRAGLQGAILASDLPPGEFDPAGEPSEPTELEPAPPEPSDWEPLDIPCTDDDSSWDVFIPDDDEEDPLPGPGDFWIDSSQEDRGEGPSGS